MMIAGVRFPRRDRFSPSHLIYLLYILLNFVSGDEHSGVWFTQEPQDVTVVSGGAATLDCTAASIVEASPPTITWRTSEGQEINYITDPHRTQLRNGSLYISAVVGSEDGSEEYECVASVESIGSVVSRRAKVSVARLGPLLPSGSPPSQQLFLGETAHFPCQAQGRPPPSVLWLKDHAPLVLDESRMLVLPSGSLEIDDVQLSDAGTYRCNVSGLDRHRTSEKAVLTVEQDADGVRPPMAPMFVAVPHPTVALEGSTVTLDCAANGNPRPWISWLKDGVNIDMADLDSRFSKVGTGSLQIRGLVEGDAGSYQCRAENREDSADAEATLHVQVAPRLIKKPMSKVAMVRSDIELECEVYAKPEPKVTWLKNGELIKQGHYMQVVNGNNLRILGLLKQDFGIFQCVASNPAGNVQAAALLTVETPERRYPNLSWAGPGRSDVGPPQDLEAAIVNPRFVTLRWKPPLNAPAEVLAYTIFYTQESSNRERVVNTSRSRLEEVIVSDLSPNTGYRFRVAAMTEGGLSEATPPLSVTTKPELKVPGSPRVLRSVAVSPTEIYVSWAPPVVTYGEIRNYRLFYFESVTAEEHHVETTETHFKLTGLKKFTEYIVWVVALNHNGGGTASVEVTIRTLSDTPSEPPTNVTLEAASSTSVIVRWEPPPPEGLNGVITGYKVRYRMKGGRGRSETVTTAGNRRLYTLTGLERSSVYQVRVWAMTVNGTGPPTDWYTIETYENDLDESNVPDAPNGMKVKASADSITVMWNPPKNQNIMVRDYIIGWGKGIPDEYAERLDGKQRFFVIRNLEGNSEYVISLRAHNDKGNGPPIYENVRTRDEAPPDPVTPLPPPVGLKATVLSPNTVVLFWTDMTLPYSQVVTDNRYYVVRYGQYHHGSIAPRYKYHNSTVLNYMIDDLKPFTQYEFTVKLVKGRRESSWSMVVLNTTMEAPPGSAPRDLTVVNVEGSPGSVSLSWQPPKTPNGHIIGYIVSYTTDVTSKARDWITETIQGDKMAATILALSLSTTYYFQVQARNSKGYSPNSTIVSITTPASPDAVDFNLSLTKASGGGKGSVSLAVQYMIGVGIATVVVLIALVATVLCCRTKRSSPTRSTKGYTKGKGSTSNIKPPDLWIHHDQMELKNLEKGQDQVSTSTLPREHTSTLEKPHHYPSQSNYMGSQLQPLLSEEKTATARRGLKPKPITIPVDASPPPFLTESVGCTTPGAGSATPQSTNETRPLYPRTQYSISRAHVTVDPSVAENPYVVHPTASVTYEPPPPGQQSNYSSGDSKRLQGHPLKSFSVPAPPPQSAPTTPQQKHIVTVRAQGSSPYKKGTGYPSGVSTSPVPSKSTHSDDLPKIQPSYSTEELNQEMANLEGLMKDLNAITASEFEC